MGLIRTIENLIVGKTEEIAMSCDVPFTSIDMKSPTSVDGF